MEGEEICAKTGVIRKIKKAETTPFFVKKREGAVSRVRQPESASYVS